MNIERNKINPGILKEKKLLDSLAIEIAREFGMEKKEALLLLKIDISKGLDELKKEINKQNDGISKKLKNKELEKLFFTIKGALEVIEKSSKIEIKILKEDIEGAINIADFKNYLEDYLPIELLAKAKNPKNIHEHILGFALGTTNSIIKTIELLYKIGKGIITAPIDIYMIISGKAKTNSFKDI